MGAAVLSEAVTKQCSPWSLQLAAGVILQLQLEGQDAKCLKQPLDELFRERAWLRVPSHFVRGATLHVSALTRPVQLFATLGGAEGPATAMSAAGLRGNQFR
mmetsp:Transcript_78096/g.135467  ORF Transcript_78096/g.135467 Transcript_78096/m.135467 type:complete len:102 (-) Transcript_78096:9-314(-)